MTTNNTESEPPEEEMLVSNFPQLAVRIRPDQHEALKELLPRGVKSAFFEILVDEVIRLLRAREPKEFLGLIVSGEASFIDIVLLPPHDDA